MMKKEADDVCPLHTLPTSKMVEKGRAGPRSLPLSARSAITHPFLQLIDVLR